MSKSYVEKLKDPRWQKMRLEVLNRDDFSCVSCGDSEETLHIHHCYYDWELEPWEYELKSLITLCATCHEQETAIGYTYKNKLSAEIARNGVFSDGFAEIVLAIECGHGLFFENEPSITALCQVFLDKELAQSIIDNFYEKIRK